MGLGLGVGVGLRLWLGLRRRQGSALPLQPKQGEAYGPDRTRACCPRARR